MNDTVDKTYVCQKCGKEFDDWKKFRFHVGWHTAEDIFLKKAQQKKEADEVTRLDRKFICFRCGKEFIKSLTDNEYRIYLKYHTHTYCSKHCANTHKLSEENKLKIRKKKKKRYNKNQDKCRCKKCGREYVFDKKLIPGSTKVFCSLECREYYQTHKTEFLSEETRQRYSEGGRKGGRKSMQTQKEVRRSKNEMAFCELCEKTFGNVLHNEAMFNGWDADVILPDYKVAVLWNGKWHYEKITAKHSVEQVQNRDKIKIQEIEKAGYEAYVIKDIGKRSNKKVAEEFEKFKLFLESKIKN